MESIECPRCKTTKYGNPNMKLMINVCAHTLCETCVEQVFLRGAAGCPSCNKVIKKSDFRYQVFEDTYIEKEIAIRKKILKDFNETEKDFPTLKDFNDYLEKIETFIFNLANNFEEEKTYNMIEEYKKELKQMHANQRQRAEILAKETISFVYKPLYINLEGPSLPQDDDLKRNYTSYVLPPITDYHKAGGFVPILPVKRQLQEAFSGLFISTKD